MSQAFEGTNERRLKPLGRSDLALETEDVIARPIRKARGSMFANQAHGFRNVPRVRIALFHQAHRQSMSAEDQLNARAVGKLAQYFANVGGERLDVQRVIVEMLDAALGKTLNRLAVHAAPLLQAAQRGGVGIVRIERKKYKFIEAAGFFE